MKYWVFNEKQLNDALRAYQGECSAPVEHGTAYQRAEAVRDFLHSTAAHSHRLINDDNPTSGAAA